MVRPHLWEGGGGRLHLPLGPWSQELGRLGPLRAAAPPSPIIPRSCSLEASTHLLLQAFPGYVHLPQAILDLFPGFLESRPRFPVLELPGSL